MTLLDQTYAAASSPPFAMKQNRHEIMTFHRWLDGVLPKHYRILEIGIGHGGHFQMLMRRPGAEFAVGVDMDTHPDGSDTPYTLGTNSASLLRRHAEQLGMDCGCTIDFIFGDSTLPATAEAVRKLGPFDLIFVDGCHRHEIASQDVDNYGAMLTPSGILAMHDIKWGLDEANPAKTMGTAKLWLELKTTRDILFEVADPAQSAMGIGAMRGKG